MLGNHIGSELLAEENVGSMQENGCITVKDLFQQLANQFYPKRWEDGVTNLKTLGVPAGYQAKAQD